MISIKATIMLVLVISSFVVPKAAAQPDKYSRMAPVDEYLMERNAEILPARSAAPDSISRDATLGLSEAALFHQKALRLPAALFLPLRFFSFAPRFALCFF
jgi:hypothetical protein